MSYFKTNTLSLDGQTEQIICLDETWTNVTFVPVWNDSVAGNYVLVSGSVDEGVTWGNFGATVYLTAKTATIQTDSLGCFNALKFTLNVTSPDNSVVISFTGTS